VTQKILANLYLSQTGNLFFPTMVILRSELSIIYVNAIFDRELHYRFMQCGDFM